jgi:hypothetical protein
MTRTSKPHWPAWTCRGHFAREACFPMGRRLHTQRRKDLLKVTACRAERRFIQRTSPNYTERSPGSPRGSVASSPGPARIHHGPILTSRIRGTFVPLTF